LLALLLDGLDWATQAAVGQQHTSPLSLKCLTYVRRAAARLLFAVMVAAGRAMPPWLLKLMTGGFGQAAPRGSRRPCREAKIDKYSATHYSTQAPGDIICATSRFCQIRHFARTLDAALRAAYNFIDHANFLDPDGHERKLRRTRRSSVTGSAAGLHNQAEASTFTCSGSTSLVISATSCLRLSHRFQF